MADAFLLRRLASFLAVPSSQGTNTRRDSRSQWRVGSFRMHAASQALHPKPRESGMRGDPELMDGAFLVVSPHGLVVAAHLAVLLVKLKAVASGIKAADLLVKAIKVLHGVMLLVRSSHGVGSLILSPDVIVVGIRAAKVVIKGLSMSRKALKARGHTPGFNGRFKKLASGLKAWWGALDVVRGSKGILSEMVVATQDRFAAAHWRMILRCYELSKGALNTVEALASLKVGFVSAFGKGMLGLKAAIGGMGVMMKACVVSKELYVLLIKGLGLAQGAKEVFNLIAERRQTSTLLESARFSRKVAASLMIQGSIRQENLLEASITLSQKLASLHGSQEPCSSDVCLLLSVQGLGWQS